MQIPKLLLSLFLHHMHLLPLNIQVSLLDALGAVSDAEML